MGRLQNWFGQVPQQNQQMRGQIENNNQDYRQQVMNQNQAFRAQMPQGGGWHRIQPYNPDKPMFSHKSGGGW